MTAPQRPPSLLPTDAPEVLAALESEVRTYCRHFPAVFERARGHLLFDARGREYLDFFCGAGVLSYGHNPPRLKDRLLEYLAGDGIVHSLDLATRAKVAFLERFRDVILVPRGLRYRVQFPGPTGTNAVEAALKLARKVTGRTEIVAFRHAYHGMTLGALAVTDSPYHRAAAGVPLEHAVFLPFDGDPEAGPDPLAPLADHLESARRGARLPAAVLLETVQAEGGVRVASAGWLRGVAALARQHGVPLIVDDIQAGCGRTGPFFSFEEAGIEPDLVCLSKALSGYGLPLSLLLIRPELDVWRPGEHNGTFRGHNLAFVTATEALDAYWADGVLAAAVAVKGARVRERLEDVAARHGAGRMAVRGRGLLWGLDCGPGDTARDASREAFRRGLLLEAVGPGSRVLKLLPPLTIDEGALGLGLDVLEHSVAAVA